MEKNKCKYGEIYSLEELKEIYIKVVNQLDEVSKKTNELLKDFNFSKDSSNLINYYHPPIFLLNENKKTQVVNIIDYHISINDFKNENFYFTLDSDILQIEENKIVEHNKIINDFDSSDYGFKECLAIFDETVTSTIKNHYTYFSTFYQYIKPIIK